MNSLFREKDSLFRKEQGISRRLFKSLCDFASASAKTALNRPNFAKFPVIFPVIRESKDQGRPCRRGSFDTIRKAYFNRYPPRTPTTKIRRADLRRLISSSRPARS